MKNHMGKLGRVTMNKRKGLNMEQKRNLTGWAFLLPASILLGAAFLTLCDVAARLLFAPYELPVGIVMSFLGCPFFLYLLIRRKGGRVHA